MNIRHPISSFKTHDQTFAGMADRAIDGFTSLVWKARGVIAGAAIVAIVVLVQTDDGNEAIAEERQRAEQAEAASANLARWHRERTVRVTLEGSPERVAEIAGQVAVPLLSMPVRP